MRPIKESVSGTAMGRERRARDEIRAQKSCNQSRIGRSTNYSLLAPKGVFLEKVFLI